MSTEVANDSLVDNFTLKEQERFEHGIWLICKVDFKEERQLTINALLELTLESLMNLVKERKRERKRERERREREKERKREREKKERRKSQFTLFNETNITAVVDSPSQRSQVLDL